MKLRLPGWKVIVHFKFILHFPRKPNSPKVFASGVISYLQHNSQTTLGNWRNIAKLFSRLSLLSGSKSATEAPTHSSTPPPMLLASVSGYGPLFSTLICRYPIAVIITLPTPLACQQGTRFTLPQTNHSYCFKAARRLDDVLWSSAANARTCFASFRQL